MKGEENIWIIVCGAAVAALDGHTCSAVQPSCVTFFKRGHLASIVTLPGQLLWIALKVKPINKVPPSDNGWKNL